MKSLRSLIEELAPEPDDELVFLGDYVDRGPDSRDVVDQLIQLQDRCQVVPLMGNHELMMLGAISGLDPTHWIANGGLATLTSYGGSLSRVPPAHVEFLQSLRKHFETEREIFVHACYDGSLPMDEQCDELRYWTHLGPFFPAPHQSGKRVYVGHTPQSAGNILDLGYLVCLDTYCFGRGFLTAINLDTTELTQVDYHGHLRRPNQGPLIQWLGKKISQLSARWRDHRSTQNGSAGQAAQGTAQGNSDGTAEGTTDAAAGESAGQAGSQNEDSEHSAQLEQNGVS